MSNTPATHTVLEVTNISKHFGDHTAVNNLSFTLQAGEVLAILGPNGAGKTTTVEMCEGFITPDAGSIKVFGLDPHKHQATVRSRIGIMLQGGGAYPGIRVEEMLDLVASYSADPLDKEWLIHTVGLQRYRNTPYRRLSGGQQQRLSLACALINKPELLFLDEPTAGLDAQSRIAVWDLIRALKRDGVAVILTTHLMDEAETLADRVLIIDKGIKVAAGTPQEITTRATDRKHSINFSTSALQGATSWASDIQTTFPGSDLETTHDGQHRLNLAEAYTPHHITKLAQLLEQHNHQLHNLNTTQQSLEAVFLEITGREIR